MVTASSSGVPPRVLASGKGKFDLPRLDVEGQPRPSAQANWRLPYSFSVRLRSMSIGL